MKTDPDRLREFAEDFTLDGPEQEPGEMGARPIPPETCAHYFVPYANPERSRSCARCGRPRHDVMHRQHPEFRRAALVSGLDRALKAVRENDESMALIHVGVVQKLLEETT